MNYLQLVNAVLRRLRESEASTVQGSGNSNTYPRLIGDYINDAKEAVENSWQWSHLKQTISVAATVGVSDYVVNGTRHRFNTELVYNGTYKSEMEAVTVPWMTEQYVFGTPGSGAPQYYAYTGIDSTSDDLKITVYPLPDAAYTLKFYGTVKPNPLSADTDTLLIPSKPVILLATAMAMEERGESGGQPSINAYQAAQQALSDEISIDASKQESLTDWYSV